MENIVDVLSGKIKLSENNVKASSLDVEKDDIFIAVTGPVNDGHKYIPEVLKKGASLVVCERTPEGLSNEDLKKIIVVKDSHEALGRLMKYIFRDPSSRMKVYGVTGTNGKTTTVFLIETVLREAGLGCGMISTVYTKAADDSLSVSTMTTPGIIELYRLLGSMADSGKKAAAVEISSHAIHQKRIWGIGLDAAIFTNISPEHLDYHRNMEKYFSDKARIFDNLKAGGIAVINRDDKMVAALAHSLKSREIMTFGIEKDADVIARDITMTYDGTEFGLVIKGKQAFRVKTKLVGLHNVYNMLAASSALYGTGIDLEYIKRGLEAAEPVPGRLDPVVSSASFRVFVDYAHTPDALEKVLKYLRPVTEGKLICVFGCGGDRDRTKRPEMGKVACDICDRVILTSDNPRSEDPLAILKEIEKGVLGKRNYSIISERKKAIQEALQNAGNGDVVLIAGKGHEDYQIIGDKKFHFDDKETALESLKSMGY